ncbi:MAG: hypothetical protein M1820_005849 [Bogoriella megaspora]|nr:MAG: hypothetical protein M1820_005849 [Bogoriella megaspora]
MARIAAEAMSVDLVHRVLHPSRNLLDGSPQESKVLAELQRANNSQESGQPKTYIWKAVTGGTGTHDTSSEPVPTKETRDIVGWALFKVHQPQPNSPVAESTTSANQKAEEDVKRTAAEGMHTIAAPAATSTLKLSEDFLKRLRGEFAPAIAKHVGAKSYIHCQFLMTRPEQQGRGIGSELMKHGFKFLGADTLPTLVMTQARLHDYYEKFGFNVVHNVDIDLTEYMGANRGFGVHRNSVLVRSPGHI